MSLRVGIVGASGFLGGELVRLLSAHPNVSIAALSAGRGAGSRLGDLRPSLRGITGDVLAEFDAPALADTCDLVFLALPHGASASAAAGLLAAGSRVIDLGSDFRLADPADHERWYGRAAPDEALLGEAVYSLPELTGAPPAEARLVASPGCFATALALTIAPLAARLDPAARITSSGITGSSGSGATPSARVHHSLRMTDLVAYRPLAHQHLGEVRQLLARRGPVPAIDFVPHSAPLARGIHLTTFVPRAALDGDAGEFYRRAYAGAALVDVRPGPVSLGAVIGSMRVLIGVEESDPDTVVVFTAIDNLLKGGAGQAVQSLNLMLGWDETLALPLMGSWP